MLGETVVDETGERVESGVVGCSVRCRFLGEPDSLGQGVAGVVALTSAGAGTAGGKNGSAGLEG